MGAGRRKGEKGKGGGEGKGGGGYSGPRKGGGGGRAEQDDDWRGGTGGDAQSYSQHYGHEEDRGRPSRDGGGGNRSRAGRNRGGGAGEDAGAYVEGDYGRDVAGGGRENGTSETHREDWSRGSQGQGRGGGRKGDSRNHGGSGSGGNASNSTPDGGYNERKPLKLLPKGSKPAEAASWNEQSWHGHSWQDESWKEQEQWKEKDKRWQERDKEQWKEERDKAPSPQHGSRSQKDATAEPVAAPAPVKEPASNQSSTGGVFVSQDIRYQTQEVGDDRTQASSMPFACQDIRYMDSQDVRYAPNPPAKKQQESGQGKNKSRHRGGGNKQDNAKEGGDASEKSSNRRRRGGGGGGNSNQNSTAVGSEKVPDNSNQALSKKIRACCNLYESTLNTQHLAEAFELLESSVEKDEGCCDSASIHQLLLHHTKNAKLQRSHRICEWAKHHEIYLDVSQIVTIVTNVSQRTPSHTALGYVRCLIYECLPPEYGEERKQFFDRHTSFIFSEFMAEADACFARMNRDTSMLVAAGHTELSIMMDWDNSSATTYSLYNRDGEKGKVVYIPSAGVSHGIQRTDCVLMSFDIRLPDMAAQVPRDYDCVRDGAEVEVTAAQTDSNKPVALTVKVTSPPPPRNAFDRKDAMYRLDKLASRDQTRRMMDALKIVLAQPQDNPKGQRSSLQPSDRLQELLLVDKSTTLSKAGKTHIPLEPMDFSNSPEKAIALENFLEEAKTKYLRMLNPSQIEALTRACGHRITLIQGPPGTGKTTTAVQIVSALVNYEIVDTPMLVTADSNTAVDNLVKGIAKENLKVIRVGRPESIREDVKQYTLDGRWKELQKVEVVCATCIGASGTTLEKLRFGTVLVDECTQAAESAALVPIARGCQQVILIGDQCQLPPTVLSDVAESQNLGESLFTRLVTQGVRPVLLDTQYRMHPYICEFPSHSFYNGRLHTGVSYSKRLPPDGFQWPQRGMPVAFVNMDRSEERREGSSYVNEREADRTLKTLEEVCSSGEIGPEGVGLVTPYKGQVNLIKRLIRERVHLQKFRTGLEVESVDGFQGQEKEVIIFCAVRNNADGKVGFLSDWRRLNVMLTRARRGCIVIGSKRTLMSDALWRQWLIWASARGAIQGEAAKGTWVGRYLVDDRDGMWTVKEQLMTEPHKIAPNTTIPAVGDGKAAAKKVEAAPVEEDVVDGWEELFSPAASPTSAHQGNPAALGELEEEDWEAQADPQPGASPSRGILPPPSLSFNISEEDEVRNKSSIASLTREDDDEFEIKFERQRSNCSSSVVDDQDEIRSMGTPTHGPKSPARQQALANLGLVDDLDLDEAPPCVTAADIDAALDAAAQPEPPPELLQVTTNGGQQGNATESVTADKEN